MDFKKKCGFGCVGLRFPFGAGKKKNVTVANLSNRKVEFVPSGRAESPLREVVRKKKMTKHET